MRSVIVRHGVSWWQALIRLSGWNAEVVVTPPAWRVRGVRWLVAVVALTITYQAYALLVVPLIEPGPGAERGQAEAEAPIAGDTHPEFAELFPEGAWERGRPMVLTTQWGKLLFKEYRPSNDGRLELVPCTIVFYAPKRDNQGSGRRAIVLQAPDKAVLSFAGPLNLARAEFTKLQGARLEGEVRITSRESAPGANDALSIETRNVQILPQQIWTAHEVTFAYGPNHGSGRDLSIALSSAGGRGAASGGDALARNLETFELAHVDKLVLQVPADGLLGNLLPTSPSAGGPVDAAASRPEASNEVNVTCQGPFRFDFQKSVASLEDRVDIVRDNSDGHGDQLNCDRLQIFFDPPAAPAVTDPAAAVAANHNAVRKLAVRRIEAQGFPVTLQAPSVAVTARGQQLAYDFQTRRILLADDQNALLVYRQHRAEAPKLEYELPAEPRRLGRLWAAGPGSYQGQFGGTSDQTLTAHWCGVLELQPQDGLHVLSVVQGAEIKWNGTGRFTADELYVWLAEVPVPERADSPTPPPSPPPAADTTQLELAPAQPDVPSAVAASPPASPPRTRLTVRPVKMLAQGNVPLIPNSSRGRHHTWRSGSTSPKKTPTAKWTPHPGRRHRHRTRLLPGQSTCRRPMTVTRNWNSQATAFDCNC